MKSMKLYRLYLHPAQEEDEHPPQLDPDEGLEAAVVPLPSPKRDSSFSVLADPHFSQTTFGSEPKTIFSKSTPQNLQ
jgi:hypothetical protein